MRQHVHEVPALNPVPPVGPAAAPRECPFDCASPFIRIPDAEILDGLRRFARDRAGRRLTVREFTRWPGRPCGHAVLIKRFGTWPDALRRVGVIGGRPRRYTPERMIEILESAWLKLGRRPGSQTLRRVSGVSALPFCRHWGSLESACKAVEAFHRGRITREELLRPSAPRPPRRRANTPPALRLAILHRDNYRCKLCGRGPHSTPPADLEVDHILPVSKGGTNEEPNLRALCYTCNRGKGAKPDLTSAERQRPVSPDTATDRAEPPLCH